MLRREDRGRFSASTWKLRKENAGWNELRLVKRAGSGWRFETQRKWKKNIKKSRAIVNSCKAGMGTLMGWSGSMGQMRNWGNWDSGRWAGRSASARQCVCGQGPRPAQLRGDEGSGSRPTKFNDFVEGLRVVALAAGHLLSARNHNPHHQPGTSQRASIRRRLDFLFFLCRLFFLILCPFFLSRDTPS